MPISLAKDGVWVQLCPSGVSDEVMAILHADHHKVDHNVDHNISHGTDHNNQHQNHQSPNDHSAHAHHSHAHHNHIDHTTAAGLVDLSADASISSIETGHQMDHDADTNWQNNCQFGSSVNTDFTLVEITQITVSYQYRWLRQLPIAAEVLATQRRKQQQRAPPLYLS